MDIERDVSGKSNPTLWLFVWLALFLLHLFFSLPYRYYLGLGFDYETSARLLAFYRLSDLLPDLVLHTLCGQGGVTTPCFLIVMTFNSCLIAFILTVLLAGLKWGSTSLVHRIRASVPGETKLTK